MPPPLLTKQQQAEVCEIYQSMKISARALGKKFGVKDGVITRVLKKNNIKIRGAREYLITDVNENYFKDINTPRKAYWLGFFTADGCLAKSAGARRSINFFLAEKDGFMVKQFAKDMGYNGTIHYSYKKQQYGFLFNSSPMAKDLIESGSIDWKDHLESDLLERLRPDLMHHFVRGFLDGDGCFTANYTGAKKTKQVDMTICGDIRDFHNLSKLKNIIHENVPSLTMKKIKFTKNSAKFVWNGNNNIEAVGDWLYQDAEIKLNRKYARYLSVKYRDVFYYWRNFWDWKIKYKYTDELPSSELQNHIDKMTEVVKHGFEPLCFNKKQLAFVAEEELRQLRRFNPKSQITKDGDIYPKSAYNYGNDLILHFQPHIWSIKQNKNKSFMELERCKSECRRAVKALLTQEKSIINERRLYRELMRTGVSRASLLSTPTTISVLHLLGLQGHWFDPCAGWGNRLLAAHTLGIKYSCTDPASHQFGGLLRLVKFLGINPHIQNKKFQDIEFPKSDFIFTSPPFYDKEDYGLNDTPDTFEEWYQSFMKKLILKSQASADRVVFHVDDPMCARIEQDFLLRKISMLNENRLHAPNEWFIEVLKDNK